MNLMRIKKLFKFVWDYVKVYVLCKDGCKDACMNVYILCIMLKFQ